MIQIVLIKHNNFLSFSKLPFPALPDVVREKVKIVRRETSEVRSEEC